MNILKKYFKLKSMKLQKKTPLEKAHNLSNTLNNEVFLKREAVSYTHLTLPTS